MKKDRDQGTDNSEQGKVKSDINLIVKHHASPGNNNFAHCS
jgi:hypothetical protein